MSEGIERIRADHPSLDSASLDNPLGSRGLLEVQESCWLFRPRRGDSSDPRNQDGTLFANLEEDQKSEGGVSTVKEVDEIPRIEIDDAKQIRVTPQQ